MADIKKIYNKRSINQVMNQNQADFNIIPSDKKRKSGTTALFYHCGVMTGYVSEKADPYAKNSQWDKLTVADIEYTDGSVFENCLMPVGIDDSKAVATCKWQG